MSHDPRLAPSSLSSRIAGPALGLLLRPALLACLLAVVGCAPLDGTGYGDDDDAADRDGPEDDGEPPVGSEIYYDHDGDGATEAVDCDDDDPERYPGRPELCDGIDNDCDDLVDEGWDSDLDGWPICGGDCDDEDAQISPSSPELCDGIDNDCDSVVDEDFDNDNDGWTTCEGDCDDAHSQTNPDQYEDCDGSDDLDCDGQVGADDIECGVTPETGSWSGNYIDFTVTGGGTSLYVTYANFGSCSNGGCTTTSSTATCGAGGCSANISIGPAGTTFSVASMGCTGTFTSDTTAAGTCSDYTSCGCTATRSWTASW
jgi:hypothetical protein